MLKEKILIPQPQTKQLAAGQLSKTNKSGLLGRADQRLGPAAALCFVVLGRSEWVEGVDTQHHIWVCWYISGKDGERTSRRSMLTPPYLPSTVGTWWALGLLEKSVSVERALE